MYPAVSKFRGKRSQLVLEKYFEVSGNMPIFCLAKNKMKTFVPLSYLSGKKKNPQSSGF